MDVAHRVRTEENVPKGQVFNVVHYKDQMVEFITSFAVCNWILRLIEVVVSDSNPLYQLVS